MNTSGISRVDALRASASQLRSTVLLMNHRAQAGHLGSSLSCADLVAFLCAVSFARQKERIDQGSPPSDFILSKGHAAAVLYAGLAQFGIIEQSELETFSQDGSRLAEHPLAGAIEGVSAATGSLGHGLPIACGMAWSSLARGERRRTYVLMSDGENNEGSNWEAAMFAASQSLCNLWAIVDYNKWQATGRSDEVLALHPLAEKWMAFGWRTLEIDGNDMVQIVDCLTQPDDDTRPTVVIAHTIKGKGVSFMEDDNNWHYRSPDDSELAEALAQQGVL